MKTKDNLFVGLDIETTGSDIDAGAGLIQIGAYDGESRARFSSLVVPHAGHSVTVKAMEVNGLNLDTIHAQAPAASKVDVQLYQFLLGLGAEERSVVPIGWNVGTFDMPFVRRYLPHTAALFGYRSIDLNSIAFTLNPKKLEVPKKASKRYAELEMGRTEWHDAGFDAEAAYHSWMYFRAQVSREGVPLP